MSSTARNLGKRETADEAGETEGEASGPIGTLGFVDLIEAF